MSEISRKGARDVGTHLIVKMPGFSRWVEALVMAHVGGSVHVVLTVEADNLVLKVIALDRSVIEGARTLKRLGNKDPVLPSGLTRSDVELVEDSENWPYPSYLASLREAVNEMREKAYAQHFGGQFRITGKRPGSVLVPLSGHVGPRDGIAPSGVDPKDLVDAGSGGRWVVSQPGVGLEIGTEVTPNLGDQRIGSFCFHNRGGIGILLEWVADADVGKFIDIYRSRFPAGWWSKPSHLDALEGNADGMDGFRKAAGADTPRGESGLLLAIEDPPKDVAPEDKLAGVSRAAEVSHGLSFDARIIPVQRDARGLRHIDFRKAVDLMSETPWSDWPIAGPRTCLWVLRFIAEHYQTPTQRHNRFIVDTKLDHSSAGVAEHSACMEILWHAAVVDQLDCPQIVALEVVCRRAQMIELKYRDRVSSQNYAAGDPMQDAHLYMGRGITRGLLCVDPALERYVGSKLHDEALAAKERRKAFEEREILKKSNKDKSKNNPKGE